VYDYVLLQFPLHNTDYVQRRMCFGLFIFPCGPSIRSGTQYHSPVNVFIGCPTSITVYMPCSAYTQENLATQHYLEEVLIRNNGWLVVLVLLLALQLMCHATPHHTTSPPLGSAWPLLKGCVGGQCWRQLLPLPTGSTITQLIQFHLFYRQFRQLAFN